MNGEKWWVHERLQKKTTNNVVFLKLWWKTGYKHIFTYFTYVTIGIWAVIKFSNFIFWLWSCTYISYIIQLHTYKLRVLYDLLHRIYIYILDSNYSNYWPIYYRAVYILSYLLATWVRFPSYFDSTECCIGLIRNKCIIYWNNNITKKRNMMT